MARPVIDCAWTQALAEPGMQVPAPGRAGFRRWLPCLAVLLFAAIHAMADTPVGLAKPEKITVYPATVVLSSVRARVRLVVTGYYADGQQRDLSRAAAYALEKTGVARLDGAVLLPVADGATRLIVSAGGLRVLVPIEVANQAKPDPVRFHAEVLAVLTRQGCNAGSCHGAPEGKGGFALSMLAYAPRIDAESLIHGGQGRRVEPLEPIDSLLLKKPLLQVTHVGGKKLRKTDIAYSVLRDWIGEGARPDAANAATCAKIVVYPAGSRVLRLPSPGQQVSVLAHFSDGQVRDVTPIATFASTNQEVATVDGSGLVTGLRRGLSAVTVRYLDFVESVYFTVEEQVAGFVWNNPPERNRIDQLVHAKLRQMQVPPSPPCDDATFLRRIHLDLTGLLPTAVQARAFLADKGAGKRDTLIDTLLASDEFARFWAGKTADLMRLNRETMKEGRAELFAQWLAKSLRENQPFDQFVCAMLTALGDTRQVGATNFLAAIPKNEDAAETTAQLFMGSRINCAKCHNHPFENWTQDDYYRIAAVFARVDRANGQLAVAPAGEVIHPVSSKVMAPWGASNAVVRPLSGVPPGDSRRDQFAAWLARPGNAYFARVEANRLWAGLLARGIVHPVDDFRSTNPPSNPELLDWLAGEFERTGFDRKHLIRQICQSATYQRSSAALPLNANDATLFSHHTVRRLSAEQLQDAIGYATRTLKPVEESRGSEEARRSELAELEGKLAGERPGWIRAQLPEPLEGPNETGCRQSAWWHAGPFPEPDYATATRTAYPPEKSLDLAGPLPGGLRWSRHPEWVDGKSHEFSPRLAGAQYVTRQIHNCQAGKAVMTFGSDDGLRVWLDGKLVIDKPQPRGIAPDQDKLEVDLPVGAHTLLVKVIDAGGYSGFYFRLASFNGQPPGQAGSLVAELVATPPEQWTPAQRRLVVEAHEVTVPRIAQLRLELRQLELRADYHTQRYIPEQSEFLQAFGQPRRESPCSCERTSEPTLDQALQILNGALVSARTRAGGGVYAGLPDDNLLVEELYLSALCRLPSPAERGKLLAFIRAKQNRAEALQDLVWAVLNLREFLFQH